MYKSIAVSLSLFILLSLFASRAYAGCSSGCGTLENGQEWCWETCDGGSYPSNDGWPKGATNESEAAAGDFNSIGSWVDGTGKGHGGAYGPLGAVEVKQGEPKQETIPDPNGGQGTSLSDCATGSPCTAAQQAAAIRAGTGGYPDWNPPTAAQLAALLQQLAPLYGGAIPGIKNGSITPVISNTGTVILVPTAWLMSPKSSTVPALPGGDPASYATIPWAECKMCENGNPKKEDAPSSTCDPNALSYCSDYKLSEVSPIVQYRFPICQIYAMSNTPITKIATRAHPVPSTFAFTLTDAELQPKSCTTKFVGADGSDNPSTLLPTDLQVVECPAKIPVPPIVQDLVISSSSLPSEGYGKPIWAKRNTSVLSECVLITNALEPSTIGMPKSGQSHFAIALPFSSPWIKVAEGTYARSAAPGTTSSSLTNYLPGFVAPFNSADVDTETSIPYFLTGSGAGTVAGTVQVGSVAKVSATNWNAEGYTSTPSNSPTTLYKQLIQKKVYKEYPTSSPPPAALVLSDEITLINDATEAGYTLSSLSFSPTDAKTSYTLIIKNGSSLGNLTIDTASLNPSGSPALLIIANNITLTNPAATTIGAVIVADSLDTGSGDALHIIGNLSLSRPLVHQRKRTDSDDRKPTIFVQYSIDSYLSLLPTLGSSSREWTQIE